MGLVIGPGVQNWIQRHAAIPLSDEIYLPPDFGQSATSIMIANADGKAIRTIVGYDSETGAILEPGPGVLIPKPSLRIMYDAVHWQAIPIDAKIVAGYINGPQSQWPEEAWTHFSNARMVRITVDPTVDDGDMLDVEEGNCTPEDAPGWIRMRQTSGLAIPSIYIQASWVARLRAACVGLVYDLVVADWLPSGEPHMYPTAAATQYANPATSGGDYDLTLCASWWPRG